MSDAVLQVPTNTRRQENRDPQPEVLIAVPGPEANDNEVAVHLQKPEVRMFEMPAGTWQIMIACYAIFLLALLGATGGPHAALAIVVSAVYVTMFFGTARAMLRQAPPQPRSALHRPGAVLQTAYGPLSRSQVYAQVLVVPAAVAFFGVAVAVISATVM